ncbi:MAG: hypothetical protein ACXAEU_25370 [Candidatus Hodarchaeales archaeon]|jgi:predicted nucleic-acid-binding Zn-ribbon protein
MIFTGKCPKCDNNRIAGPHRVHGGDSHHVKIDLPGFSTATLETFTCVNCGYTEFYSDRGGLHNIISSGRFIELSNHAVAGQVQCRECGNLMFTGDKFCPKCGSSR